MTNEDCLFCKIIAGIIPVKPLYEDADLIAIQDINPQAPLHALVIPKTHIPSLNDLTPEQDALVGRMFRRAAALASERGVFRLRVTPATGDPRTHYGRFHTFARRHDGGWLFAADYDTPDGADEQAFAAATPVDDLSRFA